MRKPLYQKFSPENHTPYIVACVEGVPNADEIDALVRRQWSHLPQMFKQELMYAYLKLSPANRKYRCEARFLHTRSGILRSVAEGHSPEEAVAAIFERLSHKAEQSVSKRAGLFSKISMREGRRTETMQSV